LDGEFSEFYVEKIMTQPESSTDEINNGNKFFPPAPMATSIPTADITFPPENNNVRHAAYPVKQPEDEINEFMVEVRATKLSRCRTLLAELKEDKFPWAEFLLAVSSLAIGASLGALSSDVSYSANALLWKFLFIFLPLVGVASLTAYFFIRNTTNKAASRIATAVLNELPDPIKSK
jgi:hypothetical protein